MTKATNAKKRKRNSGHAKAESRTNSILGDSLVLQSDSDDEDELTSALTASDDESPQVTKTVKKKKVSCLSLHLS